MVLDCWVSGMPDHKAFGALFDVEVLEFWISASDFVEDLHGVGSVSCVD